MTLSRVLVLLALVAAALLLLAGPGSRMQWWEFRTGFELMRWATYLGLAVAAVSLIALLVPRLRRHSSGSLVLALVVALAVVVMPLQGMRTARSVPPIHDISTDTADPPLFQAILPLRTDAANGSDYAGEEVAAQQRQAYPDVQPLRLPVDPGQAFARALQAAEASGWEIVASDPAAGRIEATDTTFWFGFKDDVVVRVRADGQGSVIDVRSMSRVGRSDVGKNASRIREYLSMIED